MLGKITLVNLNFLEITKIDNISTADFQCPSNLSIHQGHSRFPIQNSKVHRTTFKKYLPLFLTDLLNLNLTLNQRSNRKGMINI